MNRNTALLATIATAVMCGCPGLFACFFGVIMAGVSQIPGADIDMMGSSDPTAALIFGLGAICVSLILIAIPVVVGLLTFRSAASATPPAAPQP